MEGAGVLITDGEAVLSREALVCLGTMLGSRMRGRELGLVTLSCVAAVSFLGTGAALGVAGVLALLGVLGPHVPGVPAVTGLALGCAAFFSLGVVACAGQVYVCPKGAFAGDLVLGGPGLFTP